MHVKHLAWLASCPDDSSKSKDKRTRFARYEAKSPDSPQLILPEIDGAEYLVNLLHEAGPVGSNGYGVEGLKWPDIYSWIALTGLFLCPWELRLIKELSEVYASEYNKSNGKDVPPPYSQTIALPSAEELDAKFERIFGSMQVRTE